MFGRYINRDFLKIAIKNDRFPENATLEAYWKRTASRITD